MTGDARPRSGVRALRVSAADVARRAGVSAATVSYALNGKPGVSAEVRARVLATAAELGHSLDRYERAVEPEPSRVLGLVLTDISNPFYSEFSAGTIDIARDRGYEVFVAHTQESSPTLDTVVRTMIARRVDGMVLTSLHTDDGDAIRTLRRAGMPFVQVTRRIPGLRADFIGVDETALSADILRHLLGHGYTDLAIITGPRSSSSSAERARTFAATAAELGVPLPAHRRFIAFLNAEGGRRVAQHLVDADDVPRAIACGSDAIASGVIGTLREHDLRVPDDVAVTGIDGVFPGASMLAELTTVALARRTMARIAVEQLIRRIDGHGGGALDETVPHTLRIGTSCGCPRSLMTVPRRPPRAAGAR
ncbi:LacI family DNA-binding transcriptional regulator [Actinomycetospora flava]|uniref:LacI family DNA-binding transcriptional regulator n=1 Tax=Actinomycetospora flava TaxID=3129232 RepID=A0ABU8M0C6_9PSEU